MTQLPKSNWSADILPGFEATTLQFPDDYEGPAYATLVRKRANQHTDQAILHIHGFTDYFFQVHMAEQFISHGYNFYALDLRKYGRSLSETQHPNYCRDVHEYFPEISEALRIITEQEGNDRVTVSAHSTGGLISALYADHGEERDRINALILNSPFFDLNLDRRELIMVHIFTALNAFRPFANLPPTGPVPYIQSIHTAHHGEWSFDERWRPLQGFPIYAGWLRAIFHAHKHLRQGLAIQCPVLVLHSNASIRGPQWNEDFQKADSVLNVAHIREGSRHLGKNVTVYEIEDGLHDLFLSRLEVRTRVFEEIFHWLDKLPQLSPPRT